MIDLTPVVRTNDNVASVPVLQAIMNRMHLEQQINQTIKNALETEYKEIHKMMHNTWSNLLDSFLEKNNEAETLRLNAVNQKENLLDIQGLASKFKVTKATVHNWIKRGWINGKKAGKQRFFSPEEISEFLSISGFRPEQ